MSVDPESMYLQLRELVASTPNLERDYSTPDAKRWMARADALVHASGDLADGLAFRTSMDRLGYQMHSRNVNLIMNIVHRALARAELKAPSALRGQFIAAGETLSALAAVSKVFARATRDLLLVDTYADQTIITDFAVTAPETVHVRILTAEKEARKLSLRPAMQRWRDQFGEARPLSIRTVPTASLHDRLIVVDDTETWHPGQSFNGLASRSHTSISRDDAELAALKVEAYAALWASGTDLQ